MTTIRVGRRDRYTVIDRGCLNDRRLSFRARGILGYLLDKPDDWQTSVEGLAAAAPEGREAVRTACQELEDYGYLERKKWRNRSGQWQSEWTVYERPKAQVAAIPRKPRRLTGAGQPRRIPGPQLLNTETENGPSEGHLFSLENVAGTPPPWLEQGITWDEWARQQNDEETA
jgi:hypothetical protein